MIPSMDLVGLELGALAERLVAIAQEARTLVDRERTVELADILERVRTAANRAEGPALDLLEVAEAFLRTLSRSNLGKAEIALRRFAASQSDGAVVFLSPLVDGASVRAAVVHALGDAAQPLVEVGALRVLENGRRYDLRPSLRNAARDLVEPAPFRIWRRLDAARGAAALGRMSPGDAAAYLSSQFGVTQQQAEQHLRRAPLTGAQARQPIAVPPHQVGDEHVPVLYQLASNERPRESEFPAATQLRGLAWRARCEEPPESKFRPVAAAAQAEITTEPTVSGALPLQVARWN